MKILLTTDTWVPTINGVVTSTATLRAALTAQGHEVRVLTLSGDSHTYTKDGVTSLGSLDAGLVYPGARMRAPALNRAIRDLIDWHPDVVHSQCEFSTFAPARRIAHAAGAPLIHTYHTVYEDYTHYFSPSRSMGRKMAALFTRMICADCDAVIAPTPKISRLLAGYGVHCPVRIIPTGLDLQRFAVPRDDALRSRLGLPPAERGKQDGPAQPGTAGQGKKHNRTCRFYAEFAGRRSAHRRRRPRARRAGTAGAKPRRG